MELLIITALLIVAWFFGDRAGRQRINAAAAADDHAAAYSALGCNLVLGLVVFAVLFAIIFGLAGTPLPR